MKTDYQEVLTVGIPNFERKKELEQIIQSLLKQRSHKFRILICDDNSSTGVAEMVRRYQKKSLCIDFYQNKKNLGYSGNVFRVYQLARTPYIWFLCNDDTVLPDAVSKILAAIKKYNPTVAVFDHTWLDTFGRKLSSHTIKTKVYTKPTDFKSYEPLVRVGFLSALLVKKNGQLNQIKKTQYKKNIFVQIIITLQLLKGNFRFCEISSVIVHRNVGYNYGEFFKFCMVDFINATTMLPHNFDHNKFVIWYRQHVFSFLRLYLSQKLELFRYNGKPSIKTVQSLKKHYGLGYGLVFCFSALKTLTPTWFLRKIYRIRLSQIHGGRSAQGLYELLVGRAKKDLRLTDFINYR